MKLKMKKEAKVKEPEPAEKAKEDAPAKKKKEREALPAIEGVDPGMLEIVRLLRGEDEKKAKKRRAEVKRERAKRELALCLKDTKVFNGDVGERVEEWWEEVELKLRSIEYVDLLADLDFTP